MWDMEKKAKGTFLVRKNGFKRNPTHYQAISKKGNSGENENRLYLPPE